MMRRLALLLVLVTVGACSDDPPPRPQWVVSVVTDAPVPQLGDRLLVEFYDEQGNLACSGCRRQFPIDRSTVWPITFGAVPDDRPVFVRTRLYRVDHSGADGLPTTDAIIDVLGALPRTDAVREVGITVPTSCFGIPSNPILRTTCDPQTKQSIAAPVLAPLAVDIARLRPGDWEPSRRKPCPVPAPSDMICIEGGVFLLGDVRLARFGDRSEPVPEHLVQLTPYFLDVDELTVGTYRQLVREGKLQDRFVEPRSENARCTYAGPDDASQDLWPLACVNKQGAMQICDALGKRLPTEAEWEFAATGSDEERLYPWGDGGDPCERAILGRSRSFYEAPGLQDFSFECRVPANGVIRPVGLVLGGSPLDVTRAGVRNMAGNLSEWVLDTDARYDDPCWAGPTPLLDPRCEKAGSFGVIRGGGFTDAPHTAAAAFRNAGDSLATFISTGVRCAKR